ETRCVGCCGLAPVFTINEHVYGKVAKTEVEGILKPFIDAK
ncbi:MAG: NAD(P)H-dependent oxidoreductase subunit E, partial [Clostridia bacterium]|nr:NAD(P)H-dependent oxidoreductase subunit E [Clostridia bacterium]